MGSSKKHKKHKSERREKYEEYSNNMDPSQLQRGLKLILKVGSNSTPEYSSGNSPLPLASLISGGPPTAAEAMMAAAPSSPMITNSCLSAEEQGVEEHRERHKKSKKKKKKKDREKKHKHHKEKRHRSEKHEHHHTKHSEMETIEQQSDTEMMDTSSLQGVPTSIIAVASGACMGSYRSPQKSIASATMLGAEGDSSQDGFSFMDDDTSQPLPENILMYAGITTDNSPSCRPVSKPIVPMAVSPGSSNPAVSPTKPLPDLLIPCPTATSSAAALTPKLLEAPKTPSSSSESGREPRSCVLKLKQQKSPLNKLLDHLLRFLEKRDPYHYFAWPVTDVIAPGYSKVITKPMDFSTMRQKIEDTDYKTLGEFVDDFRLMCENAIRYNHVETVYYKAAKSLMLVGMKHLQPENLMRSLKPLSGYMRDLSPKELGFELLQGDFLSGDHPSLSLDSADEGASTGADEPSSAQLEEEEKRRALRLENKPKTRFAPYVDDLTSEEILAQVQGAARAAKKRLAVSGKEKAHKMGFLRQNKDGTTSLNLLIKDENEGPEKVVSLGDLVGKLPAGSGQLHGLREDKRNESRTVKPLNYGPYTSFAPVFDSRFSNLSKEETQLVIRTYGDAACSEYAESILQFTKDSSYASMLANGLLDILTGGEHSKGVNELYDVQVQNYEQQEAAKCFANHKGLSENESREIIEAEYEKFKNTRIDFQRLRTLNDLGIDINFLDSMESEMKNFELSRRLQEHLSNNLNLIEKLRTTQHDRLSQQLPPHLSMIQPAGSDETHLAQQITQQLTDLAKKLPPSAIADQYSLRKAMGMSYAGLPPVPQPAQRIPLPEVLQTAVAMPQLNIQLPNSADPLVNANSNIPSSNNATSQLPDIDDHATSGVDLENELREFLESGPLHAASSSSADGSMAYELNF